ncbi:uracil permease [Brevibacillus agri]|uniref:Uracil permease n=1 Tax=Brevibacillus agri TaxID=51101 RepID=A0A3M8AYI5_9BACL|nr:MULTISPECIES: solute carrier family 23 protein [Brevibacillus]ELK40592.1 uracil permease [Brevibacillus agri BAB-2500]EJL42456.1 uracil-xanthine permease [Brevibacillus sp. CF112]MBY0051206.1 uracil permease [Brevibacillus agri]MCG5250401.1 NCS2 family nucleobase:cation symporter [Brevibacillus agri]MDN4093154.1 solute carrier family 23 protein [Brevibacillus agri]
MSQKNYVDVDETPHISKLLPLSIQHLFAMFGSTVLVPILTGLDVATALLTSGIGTLLFLWITKGKIPNYLGSSFAFIGPIIAVTASHGVGTALLGCFLSGIVYIIVAGIVQKAGVKWLDKVLPPVVIASVIVVIGLSLAGVAVDMATKVTVDGQSQMSLTSIEISLVTMLVTILAAVMLRGFLGLIPILIGIIVGYAYSLVRHPELIDFQKVVQAKVFAAPPLKVGEVMSVISDGSAWIAALVIAPVAFVTLAEHLGHLLVTSKVMDRDLMKNPGLHRSLLGDGIATSLAAFIGGPPATTYGENIGVLAITRVYSRVVIGLAAVFAILFAFNGKISALLMTIPTPVLGGVSIILFGIIAAQGLRMYVENKVDFANKRNMIVAAAILVTGIGGYKISFAGVGLLSDLTIDNIAFSTFLGIFLHLILPGKESAMGEASREDEKQIA